jgi:hypothetical protein
MTNVNVMAIELAPIGGGTNDGYKLGFINGAVKAAQNDTWTVTNASAVKIAIPIVGATGGADTCTVATNVITLTGATTVTGSALIVYKVK